MLQLTLNGETLADLYVAAKALVAELGVANDEPLSAVDKARLRADATIVAAGKKPASPKKSANKLVEEETPEDDVDDADNTTNDAEEDGTEYTMEDVKAVLMEAGAAYPEDKSVISKIVQAHGAKTLSSLDKKVYPKVVAMARGYIAKAKPGKKKK
jgi:hypothetical protein